MSERGVQFLAQRFQYRLPFVPDHIDLRIVRNRLQRDVRHALVDEAVADVTAHRFGAWRGSRDVAFFSLAFT